ncbi:phosphoglycerate mutase family protein [Dictyocaulus viviparus]|uniref:Phosphoglycerate mutase family protein n=1 Tax=Dictyocaulus viviparus TaxID=29172 RepID=A0A0D8XIG5_DICVI|nr:phosphoglycerate mutase family protein [Dictyocaulus viviparus]
MSFVDVDKKNNHTVHTSFAKKPKFGHLSEQIKDLCIWSSQRIRAVQTASPLEEQATNIEYWKVLNEIDTGICEGLTYNDFVLRYPKQFAERDRDKYHYRYPSGESYEDLVSRLEPVIMELERQSNILVISHQLPYLDVPLHTVIKLTPKAYSCVVEMLQFDVNATSTNSSDKLQRSLEPNNQNPPQSAFASRDNLLADSN